MGRTYRGEQRDQFKGRSKNKPKKGKQKNWSDDNSKVDNWSEKYPETTESWDR
jgi:hypothetical protein